MKRFGVLVGFLALIAAACGKAPNEGGSTFRLLSIDGNVRVQHEGDWASAEEDGKLAAGDQVDVGRDGKARIELPTGSILELGELARLSFQTPNEPRLVRGSLLADAKGQVSLAAKGFKVVARKGSVVRVDLLIGHRVGVYDGQVMVPGSGWSAAVEELQELDLVGGTAPSGPSPLRIRQDDAWDLRLLGEAIDIGAALGQKESGLRAQLQGDAATLALDKVLGPAVSPEERTALLAEFVPEALVVAAMIAREIGREPTAIVLREILLLRGLAGWEIVAGRWDVARSVLQKIGELAGQVLAEVRREAPSRVIAPSAPSRRSSSSSGGGGSSSSGGSGSSGGGKSKKPGGGGGSGGGGSDPDPPECDLACTVEGVIGDPLSGV